MFVAAISNDNFTSANGLLANTGLVQGQTALSLYDALMPMLILPSMHWRPRRSQLWRAASDDQQSGELDFAGHRRQ